MEGQVTFVMALFRDPHIQPWFQGTQEVEVANTPWKASWRNVLVSP